MSPVNITNPQKKPEYGLYVGYSIIITLLVLGIAGLILFIFGFNVASYLNIIFWTIGALLIVTCLWPGIGMLSTNRSMQKGKELHFDFLKKANNAKILDCGCGTGRHAIPLAKQMSKGSFLTGIDIYDTQSISVNSLQRVQKNAEIEGVSDRTKFTVGSVADIPFDNETFDIVTCMGVMHEVGKLKSKAFQEIHRVLKPEGLFYFRELKRLALAPFIGVWAFFTLKSEAYWEKELKNGQFKLVGRYTGGNYYEFLATKILKVSN